MASIGSMIRKFISEHQVKRLERNVKFDPAIFTAICKAMYEAAPPKSELLVLEASIQVPDTVEDAATVLWTVHCHVKAKGKKTPYALSPAATTIVSDNLHEINKVLVSQKLRTITGCTITVDVPHDKYQADFSYA